MAVTVYCTGSVKSFAVLPLVCSAEPTRTLAPVVVNVATSPVTVVPNGTLAVIVVPLIDAVTSLVRPPLCADSNLYSVIEAPALSGASGSTLGPSVGAPGILLSPHAVTTAIARSRRMMTGTLGARTAHHDTRGGT